METALDILIFFFIQPKCIVPGSLDDSKIVDKHKCLVDRYRAFSELIALTENIGMGILQLLVRKLNVTID